jgi:hypothetical protein
MEFLKVFSAVFAICSALCLWVLLSAWLYDGIISGKGRVYEIALCVNAVAFVSLLVTALVIKV